MISVKSGGDEYLASPAIVYNLNLSHLLATFSNIQMTNRNSAFSVYIPANKALILIAGYKGFSIKSFKTFQLTMKNQKGIDILVMSKEADQILIVDEQDKLRFARIDEKILLYSRATPFAHLFKNVVDQIIQKETEILQQLYEIRNFSKAIPSTKKKRNVMELFLARSVGVTYFL